MCFLPHLPPLPRMVFDFFAIRFVDQRKREVSIFLSTKRDGGSGAWAKGERITELRKEKIVNP